MKNGGIVKNSLKIESTISNAQTFLNIQKEYGSFSTYIWSFTNDKPINTYHKQMRDIPSITLLSDVILKDLKKDLDLLDLLLSMSFCKQ